MTFTEAAIEILRMVGRPLHYKKITELAIAKNLLSHVGKAPELTMSTRLTLAAQRGEESPIIRVKPGVFALRSFPPEVLALAESGQDNENEEIEAGPISQEGKEESGAEEAQQSEEREESEARPRLNIPGAELFPPEEDDDKPIFADLDEEEEESPPQEARAKADDDEEENEAFEQRPWRRGRERRERFEESEEEAQADWMGRELADAVVAVLMQEGRAMGLTAIAAELVRRGRLAGDPHLLAPTVAASVRADFVRAERKWLKPRFRWTPEGLTLYEWHLPRDLIYRERELMRAGERYRDAARKAFLRKLNELPMSVFAELLAAWLNAEGIVGLRGIRRPTSSPSEMHLAGSMRRGFADLPIGIVVLRRVPEVGIERIVELRGSLHHYGQAQVGWIVSTGQFTSEAIEEAAAEGAAPIALFDGRALAEAMEMHGIGLKRVPFSLPILDLDAFEQVRNGETGSREKGRFQRASGKPAVIQATQEEESASPEEAPDEEGHEAPGREMPRNENGFRRRRRNRRRKRERAYEERHEGAEASTETTETETNEASGEKELEIEGVDMDDGVQSGETHEDSGDDHFDLE
ncbi:MAG: HTH domain-containing protein [Sandaracinaceae bacterium]|nr:HTH domain-containing protein [Sandaracinaceae bacterium]MDW8245735.1 HTH domain-containing protein [Sandaracinaceae bacterium]